MKTDEISDYDPAPTEREAAGVGLLLVQGEYKGSSDFDKAMRLLQSAILKGNKKTKKK